MRRVVPIEHLGLGWRTFPLSRHALAVLAMLDTADFKGRAGPTAMLLALWRRGLVARLYRARGEGWLHAGWRITQRGRVRLTEEPTGRPSVSTDKL